MADEYFKDLRILEKTPFITKNQFYNQYGKSILNDNFLFITHCIPIFQFNIDTGQLYPIIKKVKHNFFEYPDYEIVEWFLKPHILLNNNPPINYIYHEVNRIDSILSHINSLNS